MPAAHTHTRGPLQLCLGFSGAVHRARVELRRIQNPCMRLPPMIDSHGRTGYLCHEPTVRQACTDHKPTRTKVRGFED